MNATTASIRPARRDDVAGCAQTMMAAFESDPVMRFLLPSDSVYAAVAPIVCRNVMRRSLAVDGLWCIRDRRAFAAWEPPNSPAVEAEREEFDLSLVEIERFVALNTVIAEHRPTAPHWYLQVLGTDPEIQANGYGGALMNTVFAQADRSGTPCYLETETPRLVAYYERHGFEVRSEWDIPLGGPHMWGMLRRR